MKSSKLRFHYEKGTPYFWPIVKHSIKVGRQSTYLEDRKDIILMVKYWIIMSLQQFILLLKRVFSMLGETSRNTKLTISSDPVKRD